MRSLRDAFGELRSLIATRRSAQGWEALTARLEQHEDDPALDDHLPYLDAALSSWPDALRCATDLQRDRLERGEEPGALWPLIRALKLSGHARQQHQISAILAHEATLKLPTLLLTTAPQPDEVWIEHVAPRPALRQLQLGFNSISAGQLGPLLEAARWERLEALELGWTQDVLAQAAHALRHADALSHLRTLSLAWSRLGPTSVAALARAELPALTTLDLEHCRLNDQAASTLIQTMRLPALTDLTLGNNALGAATVTALADPSNLPALRRLALDSAELSHDELVALLTTPRAASLEKLDLRHNGDPAQHAALRQLAPPSVEVLLRR